MINRFDGENEEFSNFYPCIIYFKGLKFESIEHAYVAAKSNDYFFWKIISQLPSEKAGLAKKRGRSIKLRDDWDEIKLKTMEELLRKKFSVKKFKEKLMFTGDEYLEEGNYWHDNYWGSCYCKKCKNIEGQNMLGKLLMKIRRELE